MLSLRKVRAFLPHRFPSHNIISCCSKNTWAVTKGNTLLFYAKNGIDDEYDTPIIPKEYLFGNLEYRIPQVSPDGQFLAYLAPNYNDGSCCFIHVRQLNSEFSDDKDQTYEDTIICPDNRIHHFFWAEDSRTILFYANGDFKAGSEDFHLWSVNAISIFDQLKVIKDPNASLSPSVKKDFDYLQYIKDLTPGRNVKAQNVITNPNYEHLCFVATNQRNERLFDVYKCNIYTGELVLDTLNPGDVISWGSNGKNDQSVFEIKYALAKNQSDSSTTIRVCNEYNGGDPNIVKEWQNLYTYPYGELGKFIAFCGDGNNCWITTSSERDKVALIKINLCTGKQVLSKSNNPIEFANEKSDIGEIVLDENDNDVTMVSFNHARREILFQDEKLKSHYLSIVHQGPVKSVDEVRIISKSRSGTIWIVSYEPSDAPAFFALYNTDHGKIIPLFCSQSRLLRYVKSMSTMEVVSISTRDRMNLVAYLTKPRYYFNKKQLPLVLLVHGGPWERDYYCFNPIVQWLANRGYVVLQVNFRGSTGYGKEFLHRADRQWGIGSMQHDLTDSVKWCIEQGIADRNNICIFGTSYGGYACLSGLCFTPDLYKCGVDISGVSPMNMTSQKFYNLFSYTY